jgi:two-component system KDP operon response regulator KdpE
MYVKKVLIIEDSDEIVESISIALRIRWPQVKTLYTDKGEQGIEMVEKEKPDIVILDIGLPDMSGFDVLKQIRLFSQVPVMILTVRKDEADVVKGLEMGADEYVIKPFRQLELLSRIRVLTRRPHLLGEETPIIACQFHLNPINRTLTY